MFADSGVVPVPVTGICPTGGGRSVIELIRRKNAAIVSELSRILATAQGFEPRSTDPESVVLPLDEAVRKMVPPARFARALQGSEPCVLLLHQRGIDACASRTTSQAFSEAAIGKT